jgi:hypothetical protein
MALKERLERESAERERQRIEERLFMETNARNKYTREISFLEDWLREWTANASDIEKWVNALDGIRAETEARIVEIERTAPETSDDPVEVYRIRNVRGALRDELVQLQDRLEAINGKGRFSNTDLPELLAARGIRPHEGQTSLTRGPGRVPLPRARKALDALKTEIQRVETELAAARAALAALDVNS